MKTLLPAALALALCGTAFAEKLPRKESNVSLRNEVQLAIDKGLAWLAKQQQPDGSFSNPEHPSLTALPVLAFLREPSGKYAGAAKPEHIEKALAFIRSKAKPDGSIFEKGLSNYNTSICLTTLLAVGNPKDEPLIAAANRFVIGQQAKGMANESLDGGIGYGETGVSPKRKHPDLDNTLIALEALRAYKAARPATEVAAGSDLDWNAAIAFISRCQNLPETNPAASKEPTDRGGFIYYPGFSNAAPSDGSAPLRSYGSMTYAGLLSFIYADLQKDDQRVVAALDWLRKNYDLKQNPGMGAAGYYYYLHLMARGLAAAGVETLETADGRKIDWARDLALRIIDLQQPNGSWINEESARWMEKDAVLVTSYCVLALAIAHDQL
jgi:squalene-hopene/tetraprenyl-beta-curcumene cyclase